MAPERKVSNPLALAVLALLRERPMHPYEMASLMRERGKHESIKLNYGSLYTVIELLQRERFIVPRKTVREGRRPERTVYALTPAGRAELRDWMRELLSTPVKEYPQFEAALSLLPVLPPEEATAQLEERAHRLEEAVARMRSGMEAARATGLARLFLIEHEYELVLQEAELRWVRDLVREIKGATLSGMHEWESLHSAASVGDADRSEEDR